MATTALPAGTNVLDVLKKKMRSMKDELDHAKEVYEESSIEYSKEKRRREEVSY